MYKMIIVEDEKWEREGLMDFLDWNSLGIELSGLACNGLEGVEKARELRPEIIITDIKMPGMDGLKMSRNIREFLPDVKIVILTGYDDFKLARDAINISANAYILKPVGKAELQDVLGKVVEECNRDFKRFEEEKKLQDLLNKNRISISKELISGVLKEKAPYGVLQQIAQLRLIPSCGRYAVIAAGFNHAERTGPSLEDGGNDAEAYFNEVLDFNGLAEEVGLNLTLHRSDEIVYLIAGHENLSDDNLERAANSVAERICQKGFEAVAGFGTIVDSIDKLHISCQQARDALNFGLFWGDCKTVSYTGNESLQPDQTGNVGEFLVRGNYFTKQLMHSLRAADGERINALLGEMFQLIEESRWADRNRIANFLYGLLNETSLLFYNTNLSELDEGTAGTFLLSLPEYGSIKGYVCGFFEKALAIIMDKKGNKDEYVVKKVEQIISERYQSDISIKTIAAEIYLSPNYIGSVFKKCTGVPFNDYLCQFRMEKAKELLQSPKNKVSKVAREVGIPNSSYFCQLFKEMFGIAPGEYQEIIMRGNT